MENQTQKWVNFAYVAAAALVAFILYTYGVRLASILELESKVRNMGIKVPLDTLLRLSSILIAALAAFLAFRHERANNFMNEVVEELSKVTWPTQKETSSATFIVLIMVLISGMVLGFLDLLWTRLLTKFF